MRVLERAELALPGIRVLQLELTTYDARQIRALVAFEDNGVAPQRVQIRWRLNPSMGMQSFHGFSPSLVQLHIVRDPLLRLEERVLDFLALLSAARHLPFLGGSNPTIELAPGQQAFDEYRIGRALVKRGWCQSIDPEKIQIVYL